MAAVRQDTHKMAPENLARSFQDVVVDVLVEKTIHAAKVYQVKQIVLAGGVAANSQLREVLTETVAQQLPKVTLTIPPLWCCTDNAAMIASAALEMYALNQFEDLSLSCKPMIDLEG